MTHMEVAGETMNEMLSQAMQHQASGGMELELPPKSFIDMQGEMATNMSDKLVAISQAVHTVIDPAATDARR